MGDQGVLARDLPTACCGYVIPAGTEILLDRLHSPKQFMASYPIGAVQVGDKWIPDVSVHWFNSKEPGVLEPPFRAVHKVKASKVWFQ